MDHLPRAALAALSAPGGARRHLLRNLTALLGVGGVFTFLAPAESEARRLGAPQAEGKRKKRRKKCKRKRTAKICANTCGPVKSRKTCRKRVDCGACRRAGERCCRGDCVPAAWVNQMTFGNDVSASDQFGIPVDVTLSTDGLTALVADALKHRIAVWRRTSPSLADWSPQETFGSEGSAANHFDFPTGVILTGDDLTALVADGNNNRVSVWRRSSPGTADWAPQIAFGSEGSASDQFDFPSGVAVTADGRSALVTDGNNQRVSVWRRSSASAVDWSPQITFGSAGSASDQFDLPAGLSVTADGLTALVADRSNNRISVWKRSSPSGVDWSPLTTFGSLGSARDQLTFAHDVTLMADDLTALVGDTDNDRVAVWTRPDVSSAAWSPQAIFGSQGSGPTQFQGAAGVAVTADGLTVLVADRANDRISVWVGACPA